MKPFDLLEWRREAEASTYAFMHFISSELAAQPGVQTFTWAFLLLSKKSGFFIAYRSAVWGM